MITVMKKAAAVVLVLTMILSLAGCGGKKEADTLGSKLFNTFKTEIAKSDDLITVAEAVADQKVSGYDCGVMAVEEGYLNGFAEEVDGFETGVMFAPWIGSVPFVGYIFKTEDPKALMEQLEKKADPRWNICTEAEETFMEAEGNYVFFAMLPGEE